MLGARIFLAWLAGSCLVVLAAISAVNVAIDSGGAFRRQDGKAEAFISEYVRALSVSEHGLIAVPEERAVKVELARSRVADCYVIGSSHEMAINLQRMPIMASRCDTLVNLAVSGAGLEETLTFLSVVARKPGASRIFVGLSPWLFRHNGDQRWLEIEKPYLAARKQFGLGPVQRPHALAQKLNPINADYFIHNIRTWLRRDTTTREIHPAWPPSQLGPDDGIFASDGSFSYPQAYIDKMPGAEHLIGTGTYKLTPQSRVDRSAVDDFVAALTHMMAAGADVTLLMLPYHPKVMECRSAWVCAELRSHADIARDIAARLNLPVIGGFDPRPYGLRHEDFYDDHHVAAASLHKIVR